MKLFSIFLAVVSLLSGNIQFSIFFSFLLFISYKNYEKTLSVIPYLFSFLIAYPVAFTGETAWYRNAIYVFSIFVLIHMSYKKKQSYINVKAWQKNVLLILIVASLIIYIPIIIETYFNLGIFTGSEENYIGNKRASHMLGFAMPMIIGPVLVIIIISTFNDRTDFETLYRVLKLLTWIIVIFSLIRYVARIEFIPQSYTTTVRIDGYRLSGFTNPDAIGYGKSLLISLAFLFSYSMSKQKLRKDNLLLFLVMLSLFMTFSRIIVASSLVVIFVVVIYNFKGSLKYKRLMVLGLLISILFISGFMDRFISRNAAAEKNAYGINMSGRDLIYEVTIPIIVASPYVGLRPGGYNSLLIKGFSYRREGSTGEMKFVSAHSFYIVVALEWGLPFLIFLVCIMLHCIYLLHLTIRLTRKFIFIKGFNNIRIWSGAFLSLIVGLLILGITDYISYPFIFVVIGFSWSLYLLANKMVFLHLKLIKLNHAKVTIYHADSSDT